MKEKKIVHLPLESLMKEGTNQRNRVVEEVMIALFARLPDKAGQKSDFALSDGTKCWIKKFHPPKENVAGEWTYGFDVEFQENYPLAHLEFSVHCSGWERVLAAPIPE